MVRDSSKDVGLAAMRPERASRLRVGPDEYLVFSMPSSRNLTRAEWDVAWLVVAGRKNRQIAEKRGTTLRTVANQVASIYRKLSINRRAELVALLAVCPRVPT
jgi:DNA-binding NarL/FixJ family response regulator